MKTISIPVLLSILAMSPLHAQERPPAPPKIISPRPSIPVSPERERERWAERTRLEDQKSMRRVDQKSTRWADQDSLLSQNYTVTVAGSMGEKDAMNVVLCGNSRHFMAHLAESSTHVNVTLTEQDGKLLVEYTISSRIEVSTSNENAEYRDGSVTGSFVATLGKPFTVLQVGKSGLTISVDKSAN